MVRYSDNQRQIDCFIPNLLMELNPKKPLYKLANKVPWTVIENQFEHLYANTGRPAHPIRLMVGLTLLQRIENLSDEMVVERFTRDVYYQFFCGKACFQIHQPCAASDLTHFRKRIGEKGVEFLLQLSIKLHGDKVRKAKRIIVDTTVQEKNITYPTNAKLFRQVINACNRLAKQVGVKLRQSYKFVSKKLMYAIRSTRSGRKKALKKLKVIAARLVRDLERKLLDKGLLSAHKPILKLMEKVVNQEKKDKNKVYSLHAPEVSCISKGKPHKRYEFGSKMSVACVGGSNVVVSMDNFSGNSYDGKTFGKALASVPCNCDKDFEEVLVDRGYVGHGLKGKTQVRLPGSGKRGSPCRSQLDKGAGGSRSSIEAVISHLKHDHGLSRNRLKGSIGDVMNGLLSGLGWNMKLLMRAL